jgi:F-type H+-transporting ATPase subunit delta
MKISSNRFAQALSKNFSSEKELSEVLQELTKFRDVASKTSAWKPLKSAFKKPSEKIQLLSPFFSALALKESTQAALLSLVNIGQMADLSKVLDALKTERLKKYDIQEAEAISVKPLSAEERKKIMALAEKLSGHKILLEEKENKAILGGLILKIGDTLIDGSILRKIKEIKKLITA